MKSAAEEQNENTETAAEENPEIVTELAEGRGRFQKEYLLSNGQRMLAVYPTAVHYEEDGEWKEIDNTLRREQRGSEDVYRNTAGAWDVALPASLDGGSAVELTYLLPQEWMNAAERAYPVVLDPIVEADLRAKNIQDQTVAPGKNFNYLWGMVEAGYYAPYGVERFYMQYVDLPALTSADVVVQASISL